MAYKLSILIPTLECRNKLFCEAIQALNSQIDRSIVQVIINKDNGQKSIGKKRNELLQLAEGEYVCFFDDDDMPSSNYIEEVLKGIEKGVDCVSLRGVITWDGINPEIFEHSIRYSEYKTNYDSAIKYERYPNHLNAIKASIAKQFKFPEVNFGEDTDWATQIFKSGLIKTEHYINSVIYHYNYVTTK